MKNFSWNNFLRGTVIFISWSIVIGLGFVLFGVGVMLWKRAQPPVVVIKQDKIPEQIPGAIFLIDKTGIHRTSITLKTGDRLVVVQQYSDTIVLKSIYKENQHLQQFTK